LALIRGGLQDDVEINLGSVNFKYSAAADKDVYGGFVGAGLYQKLNQNLDLVADVEAGHLSGDEDYLNGRVTLQYRF
jgi:hypothetical protein